MKILLLPAVIIALCSATPQSFAQAAVPPPPTPTQPQRLPEFTIGQSGAAELAKAIDVLGQHLRDTGQEVPNVILGAGIEQLPVPSLTLRNISGLDAVQMIATAAGCELERIPAAEDPSRAAGWLIRVKSRAPAPGADPAAATKATGAPPSAFGGSASGIAGAPPAAMPSPLARSAATLDTATLDLARGPASTRDGARLAIVSYGAQAGDPSGAMTMVYPVGGLLAEGKSSEAMSALEDALKTAIDSAGLAGEKPRLSFHEGTKVLIIKGSQELQQLVGSFLDAMEKNRASASAGELGQAKNQIALTRETAELREREMSMQLKRLEAQISELDAERRALLRRSEELEAKLPKTGPPAENPRR